MTRDEAIRAIQAHRNELERLGVRSLSLFGSLARDEASPASDVDVLVEFDTVTFDRFMDLKFLLEGILDRKVDLVTDRALRPELRQRIEPELLRVA